MRELTRDRRTRRREKVREKERRRTVQTQLDRLKEKWRKRREAIEKRDLWIQRTSVK